KGVSVVEEMSDQVRGILFVFLVLLVLFVWSHFFSPPVPAPAQKQTAPVSQAGSSQRVTTSSATSALAKPGDIPVVQASAEKLVTIDSALYSVTVSNRGGLVRSWKLKKYFDDQNPPRPLDLVDPNTAPQLGWPFSVVLSDQQLEAKANSALYEITPD